MDDKQMMQLLIRLKAQKAGLNDNAITNMLGIPPPDSTDQQLKDQQLKNAKLEGQIKSANIADKKDVKKEQDKLLQSTADAIQNGSMYIDEVGKSKPLILDILKGRGVKVSDLKSKPAKESAAERQQRITSTNILQDLNLFEKNYNEAGLKSSVPILSNIMGLVPSGTGLSPESADFDAQRNAMAYSIASAVGQQKGQGVSDKDIKYWRETLPSRGDTPQQAKQKMDNLRQQLATRLGQDPTKSTIQTGGSNNSARPSLSSFEK